MKLNKKVIESGIVAAAFAVIAAGAVVPNYTADSVSQLSQPGKAGIMAAMAFNGEVRETATIEKTDIDIVTSSQEATKSLQAIELQVRKNTRETPELKETAEWQNRLMVDVKDSLNIREKASSRSKAVGKLFKGGAAEIIKREGAWVKIKSGSVTGYVKAEYCVFDQDAEKLADKLGTYYVISKTDGLRVRDKASEDSKIYTVVDKGSRLKLNKNAKAIDGWVAVKYSGETAYVAEEYADIKQILGKAMSMKEIRAQIEEETEKKAERQAENRRKSSSVKTASTEQKEAISVSVDDATLLAAIIQCEAGGESYQGKLAVGAVVMNRVRSSSYPDSISGVIYQSGQFGPASSGKLSRQLNAGVSGSCLEAAKQAIAGADNVDGALFFRSKNSGRDGIIIGNHVFF